MFELARQMLVYLEDCPSSMTTSSHNYIMTSDNNCNCYTLTHISSEQVVLFGIFSRDPSSR